MSASEIKNKLQYNYAHLALPILALGNPNKFYQDVSGAKGQQYLENIWQGLSNKMGIRQSPVGLAVSKIELSEAAEVLVIKMPKPAGVPEAFFAGVAFNIKKKFMGKEITAVRYFTLELGKNPFDGSEEYHFCEWVGSAIERKHENYGKLPDTKEQNFATAIKYVLQFPAN